ncbi:coenzyme F420-0:L-glutamate ligase [Candidatus Berkelbacteria bacterium]|nr:coenzyme F420-0:L-glutamate ligase [Candidatus Berkelbacteria bacterium]
MTIKSIKTHKINGKQTILDVLGQYLPPLGERSIVAITSKIVAICEGRVVKIGSITKEALVKKEADYYINPTSTNDYAILTVKNNMFIPSAGVDESNGNGYYILWPKDSQKTAVMIRTWLTKRFKRKHVGVIITDSRTTPLRWGTTGVALGYSGFAGIKNYIGTNDIFDRTLEVTKANVVDPLAAMAVLAMGEGAEQTPIAVLENVKFAKFNRNYPTKKELALLNVGLKDPMYEPMLATAPWQRRIN